MGTCIKCQKKFDTWFDYNAHAFQKSCKKAIVPERTTNRTKEEIVASWEYRNHKFLVY